MNAFRKLHFPKISLTLFIIGALIMLAIPVRIYLGAWLNLPADDADFATVVFPSIILPILIIGATPLLLTLLLWIPLRKRGFRFFDLFYPASMLGAIAIFIFFHIDLLA